MTRHFVLLAIFVAVGTSDTIAAILTDAESALHPYLTALGSVEFVCPAHIVTATKR